MDGTNEDYLVGIEFRHVAARMKLVIDVHRLQVLKPKRTSVAGVGGTDQNSGRVQFIGQHLKVNRVWVNVVSPRNGEFHCAAVRNAYTPGILVVVVDRPRFE